MNNNQLRYSLEMAATASSDSRDLCRVSALDLVVLGFVLLCSCVPVQHVVHCQLGAAVHELFHGLGINHMHSRTDRDDYVQIDTSVVEVQSIQSI